MRAGIIVIGNEVLSGKVSEINANWLVARFHELGTPVCRVSIIPDDLDTIAEEVQRFSADYDVVITSGGVGPTHDDMTFEAVARAFQVPMEHSPVLEAVIQEHLPAESAAGYLRMAQLPQGTELLWDGKLPFPVTRLKNVYVMPGEPTVLRKKFTAIQERFRQNPFYLRRIWLLIDEGEIAADLDALQKAHPDVEIGSYPVYENPDYKVQVTFEAKDEERVTAAFDAFTVATDPASIWKTD